MKPSCLFQLVAMKTVLSHNCTCFEIMAPPAIWWPANIHSGWPNHTENQQSNYTNFGPKQILAPFPHKVTMMFGFLAHCLNCLDAKKQDLRTNKRNANEYMYNTSIHFIMKHPMAMNLNRDLCACSNWNKVRRGCIVDVGTTKHGQFNTFQEAAYWMLHAR